MYVQCYLKCMRIKTCFIWTGVITVAKHLMTYNTLIVCNLTHLSIYPFVYLSGFLNHFFLYLLYFYSFLSVSPFFLFISFLSVFFSLIICFVLFNIKPFSTFLVHISFFSIFKSVSIQLYHVIFYLCFKWFNPLAIFKFRVGPNLIEINQFVILSILSFIHLSINQYIHLFIYSFIH